MEKLNSYLQELLNKCGQELHLEPNKNPYIVTTDGPMDVAPSALPGTQINSMIFELIPDKVKLQLPNQPEVEFVHPHNLGPFNFCVKKSPSGFNVTITPIAKGDSDDQESEIAETAEPGEVSQALKDEADQDNGAVSEVAANESGETDTVADDGTNSMQAAEDSEAQTAATEEYEPNEYPSYTNSSSANDHEPETDAVIERNDADYEIEYAGDSRTDPSEEDQAQTQFVQTVNPGNAVPLDEVPVEQESDYEQANISPEYVDTAETGTGPETNMKATEPASTMQGYQEFEPEIATATVFTPANTNARSEMDALFVKMAEAGASDLHLSVSMPPLIRKDGKMQELEPGAPAITAESMKDLLKSIMPEDNQLQFEERNDTDFAYEIMGLARFRANVFRDRKGMGGVFRIIPSEIMTAEDLNLSKAIMDLCNLSKGLVVVTGPTGSGKSTTLCAMVDSINRNREEHIITIEDPIEFTHENQKCLVNQREVHNHTASFKNALRAALREDPDILLVGEMRDLETISIAIETAETGHLVFGTLHTTTAASTVDRIIDQFPADRQQQIRVMLSESLKGVIAQTLLPKIGGGRIAALEVLIVTPAIANLIREGKTFQIPSQMQTGKNLGMQMLNDSLIELVKKDLVEPQHAYVKAVDKDGFESLLKKNGKSI